MIDSYESGQEVVLLPNPNYYGEKPNIDKVVLKQVVDGDARVMAHQSGEADLNLQDIPSESFSIIQADKNLSTEQQVSTLSYIRNCRRHKAGCRIAVTIQQIIYNAFFICCIVQCLMYVFILKRRCIIIFDQIVRKCGNLLFCR